MVKENSSLVTHLNSKCHSPTTRRNVCILTDLVLVSNLGHVLLAPAGNKPKPSEQTFLHVLRAISEKDWYGVPSW